MLLLPPCSVALRAGVPSQLSEVIVTSRMLEEKKVQEACENVALLLFRRSEGDVKDAFNFVRQRPKR